MKKVLLGVACFGFAGWAAWGWLVEEIKSSAPPPVVDAAALVTVRLETGTKCDELAVKVSNASSRTVKAVDFTVHVYERGRSVDFASYGGHRWDHVLPPGQSFTVCYGSPPLSTVPKGQVVLVPEKQAVRFYEPGEYVP